ncbi:MAG: GNAT family N-acetyltransferase [Anaerolineales bacterium]|nr:GNAT family N-acetyltransferase [Anaerolineales bacterium]
MGNIEIRPTLTRSERTTFLTFPWRIYKGDPLWVAPILSDRAKVIDPQRGVFFNRGHAEFFIAWRDSKPIGTICCAEDFKSHEAHEWKDCMIGFFECIDDYAVAEALFDHASLWAKRLSLDALYGPYNLDYEDSYGVLIEGRDRPPVVLCGHTPPYYQDFFERYGFEKPRGENIAFAIDVDLNNPAIQRLSRLAGKVRQRGHFRVRGADLKNWHEEIDRVHNLINRSLAHLPGHIPWQREALQANLEPFVHIVDPDLVLFAETTTGETVGWFPGIPNLNEALIHVNGLRYPWNYLQLIWYMRRQPECLAIKSVLVPPEYWDTGVAVLLFDEMARRAAAKGYKWVDLSLTSDDNPRTPILAKHAGAKLYKRYRVYRKWLAPRSGKK